MNNKKTISFMNPPVRAFTSDTGKLDKKRHYIRTFLEVDITNALQELKRIRSSENKVSFLSWFIKVLGDSVANHPPIAGIKKGKHSITAFEKINISTVVEKRVDGKSVPIPLVLREVNTKSAFQINTEIQAAVDKPIESEEDYVLGRGQSSLMIKLALLIPQWLRLFIMRTIILRNPQRMQDMMGTVMVSSLGTVGRISGWIMPTSMHPLSIGIGSINQKPVVYKGEIQKRHILHLSIAFDHDIIDGMPALKFVNELIFDLETASKIE